MNERDALLRAVCDNPDDDTPRLVFADWLQENGDEHDCARAEFIRLQIDLSRGVDDSEQEDILRKREARLHKIHADKWIEKMCRWDKFEDYDQMSTYLRDHYVRGFLHHLNIPVSMFARYSRRLLEAEPMRDATAYLAGIGNGPELHAFANSPDAVRVTGIWDDRPSSYLGPTGFSRLVSSPYLTRVRRLGIFDDGIGVAGVRSLVDSALLPSLKELELQDALGSEVVYRPVSGGFLRETRCDPDEAVEILVNTPKVSGLRKLNLVFNGLTEVSIRALLDSPHLTSLRAVGIDE